MERKFPGSYAVAITQLLMVQKAPTKVRVITVLDKLPLSYLSVRFYEHTLGNLWVEPGVSVGKLMVER